MTGEESKQAVLQAAMVAESNNPVSIMLGREEGYILVATLQLALRHPEFARIGISGTARQFCDRLIEALSTDDGGLRYLLITQMLEAGFDPANDAPVNDKPVASGKVQ